MYGFLLASETISGLKQGYWIKIITGQRNFSSLGDGLLDRTFETKNGFEFFFTAKLKTFFIFAFFSFLYVLFTDKATKLEAVEPNPIMENISLPLFLSGG